MFGRDHEDQLIARDWPLTSWILSSRSTGADRPGIAARHIQLSERLDGDRDIATGCFMRRGASPPSQVWALCESDSSHVREQERQQHRLKNRFKLARLKR